MSTKEQDVAEYNARVSYELSMEGPNVKKARAQAGRISQLESKLIDLRIAASNLEMALVREVEVLSVYLAEADRKEERGRHEAWANFWRKIGIPQYRSKGGMS